MKSTKENPLQFFYYFFQNGIYIDRNKFFGQDPNFEDSYLKIIEINKEKEYIKSIIWEEGEEGGFEKISYYKNFLQNNLSEESKISIRLIKEQVKNLSIEGKDFKYYLESNLSELNELREIVLASSLLAKYDSCIESIYRIVLFLINSYPSFFENSKIPVVKEACSFLQKETNQKEGMVNKYEKKEADDKISAFKWNNNSPLNTIALYDVLKNISIEEGNEVLDKLKKAFSGKIINEPLQIKWIFTKNERFPKPSLIRVFHLLMFELKILEEVRGSKSFAQKIENIFIDKDGSPIKNVEQSRYQVINSKITDEEEEMLDKIRKAFLTDNKTSQFGSNSQKP